VSRRKHFIVNPLTGGAGRDGLDVTTQELLDEIRRLRSELKQMQEVVNSLVNIVMVEYDPGEEEYGDLPPGQRFLDMYN
jgi:hypothetical protein